MKPKENKQIITQALSLIESDRSDVFLDEFHKSLVKAVERTEGIYEAHIESAVSLLPNEKDGLETLLSAILKSKPVLRFSVKPSLLGGFRVRIGDWKLDATLANRLQQLKKNLSAGE